MRVPRRESLQGRRGANAQRWNASACAAFRVELELLAESDHEFDKQVGAEAGGGLERLRAGRRTATTSACSSARALLRSDAVQLGERDRRRDRGTMTASRADGEFGEWARARAGRGVRVKGGRRRGRGERR